MRSIPREHEELLGVSKRYVRACVRARARPHADESEMQVV